MLEILNFIFRDFWTFWGIVILMCIIGECIIASLSIIVSIFNGKDKENNKEEQNGYTNRTDE